MTAAELMVRMPNRELVERIALAELKATERQAAERRAKALRR